MIAPKVGTGPGHPEVLLKRMTGNGLWDATDPMGKYTRNLYRELPLDILTLGNHELYNGTTAQNEFLEMVSYYGVISIGSLIYGLMLMSFGDVKEKYLIVRVHLEGASTRILTSGLVKCRYKRDWRLGAFRG